MNDGLQYIDIIFIAMVAAFLVLRLRGVLGRRTGDEQDRPPIISPSSERTDNVIDLPPRVPTGAAPLEGTLAGGLTRLRQVDPSFSPDAFLDGARSAFQIILMAFAKGDRDTLQPLLAPDVMRNFSAVIDTRERKGETMETDLVAFRSVAFEAVELRGRDALVTVRFVTEQVNVTRDAADAIVEGDPNHVDDVTDIWTFRRDVTSPDPNWELVATRVPEED
ncbi:Tim44/TimA family putative adaptor protein [Pararhodospirillum oryzae]|uniref:Tim44-like domain-containing protein n=1 Tax=Pararhodospirillum oryzae TaxID=478448 RepID=A0A512H623_9PROT|nr:Tim44/TimA family putative adaptor protein [Pararhodospirillum oryzae]GEO80874.1 hypothetical protein ROR02_10050 [Pararhodospirillum oryzae]